MKLFMTFCIGVLCAYSVIAQQIPFGMDQIIEVNGTIKKGVVTHANSDNFKDLVFALPAANGFDIKYFPNLGNGVFDDGGTWPPAVPLNLLSFQSANTTYSFKDMQIGKFNTDNFDDLVIVYSETTSQGTANKVALYKHTTSGMNWQQTITLPAGTLKSVSVGNIDGNQDDIRALQDIALVVNDYVYIYKNNGLDGNNKINFGKSNNPPYFWNYIIDNTLSGLTGSLSGVRGVGFADYLVREGNLSGYDDLVLIENDGNKSRFVNNNIDVAGMPVWNQHSESTNFVPYNGFCFSNLNIGVQMADINNDGIMDILADGGVRSGAGTKPYMWPIDPYGLTYLYDIVAGDVNCDGKIDILTSERSYLLGGGTDYARPRIFINNGSGIPFQYDEPIGCYSAGINDNSWQYLSDIQNKGALGVVQFTDYVYGNPSHSHIIVVPRTDDPAPAPPKMKNLESKGRRGIQVNWHKNIEADVVGYEIWRGFGSNTHPPSIYNQIGFTSTASFLDPECVYDPSSPNKVYYKIKAKVNDSQKSEFSNILSTGFGLGIGKENAEDNNPFKFDLHQNFPNPFNPVTTISYVVPSESKVTLTVYNSLGQAVKVLVNETESVGAKEVLWNGKDETGREVASGVYVYKLQIGRQTAVKKMTLTK